eukprot:scaffold380374_cov19-Prasinocladus_malaysianus.AAC.1
MRSYRYVWPRASSTSTVLPSRHRNSYEYKYEQRLLVASDYVVRDGAELRAQFGTRTRTIAERSRSAEPPERFGFATVRGTGTSTSSDIM